MAPGAGFNPRSSNSKTQKMVLDITHRVLIKDK